MRLRYRCRRLPVRLRLAPIRPAGCRLARAADRGRAPRFHGWCRAPGCCSCPRASRRASAAAVSTRPAIRWLGGASAGRPPQRWAKGPGRWAVSVRRLGSTTQSVIPTAHPRRLQCPRAAACFAAIQPGCAQRQRPASSAPNGCSARGSGCARFCSGKGPPPHNSGARRGSGPHTTAACFRPRVQGPTARRALHSRSCRACGNRSPALGLDRGIRGHRGCCCGARGCRPTKTGRRPTGTPDPWTCGW